MMVKKNGDWAEGIIRGIADALTAFMTLQARTGISPAYSEYLLYDPVVRVARYWGWKPIGEFAVSSGHGRGDKKRIDFLLRHPRSGRRALAIELKWFTNPRRRLTVERDLKKLTSSLNGLARASPRRFLILAGTHAVGRGTASADRPWPPIAELSGRPYYHTLYRAARTRYGVTVFEIYAA